MDKRLAPVLATPGAMLLSLHITDFAIIDELEVELSPGLNVMTGETGAGKTIVVEALKLILGERASPDAIRAGKERATVTAVFDGQGIADSVRERLQEMGIDVSGEFVVHRVVSDGGRGRITVNGVPVTGGMLKGCAEHLVDVSSQHEHQLLLDPAGHVAIVDAFGGHGEIASRYREAHARWAAVAREVQELEANERLAKEKLDFLQFELRELSSAELNVGEEEAIEAERARLKHAVQLEERARAAEAALYGDAGSAVELSDRAVQLLAQCVSFDPQVARWGEAVARARAELTEVARELAQYAERLESNPARLEDLGERLHLIRALLRKHGGSIEACLAKQEKIAKEVDVVCRYDEVLEEKRGALIRAADERRQIVEKLSEARRTAGERLSKRIAKELVGLGMGKVRFAVAVERQPEEAWDEAGPDRVEFLFSPNVGEPPRALARIASGGELSRVMLAVKGALSECGGFALTSVFDEVDAGIGGATAAVVGRKLKEVAKGRQVICITHLPQVAAHGDRHLSIAKRVEGGRTVATLTRLSDEERVREIARMLGGTTVTDAAIAHAEEMITLARA